MPRRARAIEGGYPCHVLNRANARLPLFTKEADYEAFERVLEEAYGREPLRILSYCLMPNHWHLVVWPKVGAGRQVSEFMRWLTVTHTQRWHAHRHTSGTGHLYHGRFKSFPIESDDHLYTVLRYVERNPLRANDRGSTFSSLTLRSGRAPDTIWLDMIHSATMSHPGGPQWL